MEDRLKQKTGIALFWSFLDRGGQQLIQLLFMLALARLLTPQDFGLIAVLGIFTAVASLLQESGFSSALIRRKVVLNEEYSTVFYFNILVGIGIYILFFILAPYIGKFYDNEILVNLSRFLFLAFVLNAFGIVQDVNLKKRMDFKTNTRITLISGLLSGMLAVWMAYSGYGVWSLAVQIVVQALLRNVLLWIYISWTPKWLFSYPFLKEIFPFSSKLLLTSIMNQICGNLYSNIIGKYFSMGQAGYYSQGNKLNAISQSIISDGIRNVAYPLLTKMNSDQRRIKAFRKIVRVTAFISFPVAMMLIVSASSLVPILLGEQWNGVVPIVRILAIGGSVYPLYILVSTLLQYEGKTGRFLGVEFVRNMMTLLAIAFTISYGVLGLVWGISAVAILAFLLGFVVVRWIVPYTIWQVLKDISPYLVLSLLVYLPFHFIEYIIQSKIILLICQLGLASLLYLLAVNLSGSKVMSDCIALIKSRKEK